MTDNPKRCTRPSVPIAKKNAKSLLSPEATDLFIAEIVTLSVKLAADK